MLSMKAYRMVGRCLMQTIVFLQTKHKRTIFGKVSHAWLMVVLTSLLALSHYRLAEKE